MTRHSTDQVNQSVTLGDLAVSPLGFGGMAVTHVYGGLDERSARATVDAAIDAGITFIDTADVYGEPAPGAVGPAGSNEEMLAPLLGRRRDDVQLATKFGITGLSGEGARRTDGSPEYVRAACDASLRRLGVETIDLYYQHRPDPTVPIEETVGAMAELVVAGKVRQLGLSEVTADELRRAHAAHPIAAVQSEWSLWSRDVETNVVPACAELGVGFVPYSPLGRGFLTGTLTREQVAADRRGATERMGAEWDANQRVLAVVDSVARRHDATGAQIALAWLYARGREAGVAVVPIPGSRRPERNRENLRALDLVLTADDVAELNTIADVVAGSRNVVADPTWISAGRE